MLRKLIESFINDVKSELGEIAERSDSFEDSTVFRVCDIGGLLIDYFECGSIMRTNQTECSEVRDSDQT